MTTNRHEPNPTALIIGCGYLGQRVAQAWLAESRTVHALTRGRADQLRAQGLSPISGDVLEPASLQSLPQVDTLLYAVGFDRSSGKTMREIYVQGLINLLETLRQTDRLPRRFLYVSSTSVYGQTDGSNVDENSPTEPAEMSGRVVLEAEQALRTRLPDSIILRFSGIYGPNRILRQAALMAGEPLVGDADKWLNLIHVDDGVRAVKLAETQANAGDTYLIADGTPVSRRDFYTETAQLLAAPPARFEPGSESEAHSLPANRRVSNQKAREQLGFTPVYPSYREGLPHAIGESR